MIGRIRALKAAGIVGINARNANLVMHYNRRKLYPLVDDKVQTKALAVAHDIAVPELYGVIETQHDAAHLPSVLRDKKNFVIKPAKGSGGAGIMVITDSRNDRYQTASGDWLTEADIDHHLSNVLSGMYSLSGLPDEAMLEALVAFDPCFSNIAYQGVPDIRIIVFRGIPLMAMVRLPTRQSRGKANLHQGAIGVGIDINRGVTLRGVWGTQVIEEHPDTGASIENFPVPQFASMLQIAAQCAQITRLGYLGVDIVLDEFKGPQMLELNARPGLAIQIANQCGLGRRVKAIEACSQAELDALDIESRIRLGLNVAADDTRDLN